MTTDQLVESTARVAHEANRAYCATLGDTSQPPWDEAPDWQKASIRLGVNDLFTEYLADPDNFYPDAEESHNRWLELKLREGWTYGPVKDPAKKQHPCLLPFDALPLEQQFKDDLFIAIVSTFCPLLDTVEVAPAS